MKVTVCFGTVNVIVPCGNGELCVSDLIERAISRYRKATNKHSDEPVEVHNLETIDDHGILDPEDIVCEVVDDKDKLIAIFDEDHLNKRRSHNGGDGTSASSTGTASPDVFQGEDSCASSLQDELSPRIFTPIKDSCKELNQKIISPGSKRGTPPPVPPKPNRRPGQLSPARISSLETRLSEDSGISHEDLNDPIGTNLSSPRSLNIVRTDPPPVSRFRSRPSETVFAAIGTPIKTSVKHVPEPVKLVPEKIEHLSEKVDNDIRTHSTSSEYDYHSDEGLFTLGRNSTRKSMFADNPILDRWAEKQEERLFQQQENRQEPAGQATSPSAEENNFPQSRVLTSQAADESNFHEDEVNGKHDEDTHSLSSLSSSGSEPEMSVIELQPLPGEGLGLSVGGYRTADGRELGLIVQDISPEGCAARDGRLEIADRIGMVNGQNVMEVPNDRAEQIFHSMVGAPVMQLAISRTHTFIPGPDKQDTCEESQTQATHKNSEVSGTVHLDAEVDDAKVNGHGGAVQLNGEVQVPQMNGPNRVVQVMNEPVVLRSKQPHPGPRGVPSVLPGLTMKKVNKRYLLELQKGSDGLGFSITTRDNPAGGHAPIFIKSILAKGAAISDGKLKSGDQLVEVNGVKLTGKSQGEAVNVLRSTKGLVKLLVQREETVLEGGKPSIEVNEESTAQLRREGNEVLKLKIPLNVSGAAGLGVSVKGKSRAPEDEGRDSPQDKGIFVKSVISGGAAQKDGRLKPDDQLLSVNGMSLMGLTNSDAMDTLRDAMQSTRTGQAFIDVTIARRKDLDTEPGVLYASKSLEDLNAPGQERSIEAGPSKAPKPKVPERKVSDGGKILENVIRVQTVTVEEGEVDSEEDNFTTEPLNLSPIKSRNFVKRNESYCHAVDRTMSPNMILTPYGNRRQHPGRVISPLAGRGETPGQSTKESPIAESATTTASSPRSARAIITRLNDEPSTCTPRTVYPTSTVAYPTPPIGSTSDSVLSRVGPPRVPPRMDSAQDVRGNYVITQQLSAGTVSIAGYASQSDQDKFRMKPRPPPLAVPPSPTQPGPSSPPPPSYEAVMSRRESQPHTPSSPGSRFDQSSFSSDTDYTDSAPLSPLEADGVKNPFERDAIGRQSMSEKRGRAALDAKQTTFFVNRERLKEDKVEQLNSSPSRGKCLSEPELSIHSVQKVRAPRPMLLRADSEGSVLSGSRTGYPESESDKERDMRKVASTGSIIDDRTSHGRNSQRRGEVNLSFRSAVESANKEYSQRNGRYIPNGHSASQEDVQDEVPITMTSYSNFNSVQQKLAKKPFYKKGIFKMGKGRRGEYSLTDVENSSPSKVNTTKETLIDFPSEQRYRQLVQKYENHSEPEYDFSDRPKTLPSRGRKKYLAKLEHQTQEAPPKVGRVTVSQPTKV